MTNSEKPDSCGDQGPDISEHLRACPDCREGSEQLGKMIDSLGSHKELFCPEPWELYVLAESGEQPSGPVAEHLRICCDCQAKLTELRADQTTDYSIPPVLVEEFRKRFPPSEERQETLTKPPVTVDESKTDLLAPGKSKGWLETFHGLLFSSFKFPALALATAAAAVVLVVVLQPRPQIETFIALSPTDWGRSPGISLMAPKMPKAAMVIFVEDFPKLWPQEKIDALYEALKPSKEMRRQFHFLPPSQIHNALEGSKIATTRKDLGLLVNERLGAAHTFVFTIAKEGDNFDLFQDVVNAKTGESLSKTLGKGVKQSELVGALREAAQALATEASPTAN